MFFWSDILCPDLNVQELSYSGTFEAGAFGAEPLERNLQGGGGGGGGFETEAKGDLQCTPFRLKLVLNLTLECTHFFFNNSPIYTHDGASAKFSTNWHKIDNSVHNVPGLAENVQFNWAHLYIVS